MFSNSEMLVNSANQMIHAEISQQKPIDVDALMQKL